MDRVAMTVLCMHLSQWQQACEVVKEKKGVLGHLGALEARQQAMVLHRYLTEFGFTPSSRVRLGGSRNDPGAAFAAWLADNKPASKN